MAAQQRATLAAAVDEKEVEVAVGLGGRTQVTEPSRPPCPRPCPWRRLPATCARTRRQVCCQMGSLETNSAGASQSHYYVSGARARAQRVLRVVQAHTPSSPHRFGAISSDMLITATAVWSTCDRRGSPHAVSMKYRQRQRPLRLVSTEVRPLPRQLAPQLGTTTPGRVDHVHVHLNKANRPRTKKKEQLLRSALSLDCVVSK